MTTLNYNAAKPSVICQSIGLNILQQLESNKRSAPHLILGAPGTAKTEMIGTTVLEMLEKQTGTTWSFNDKLRVSQIEAIDVRGAMYIDNNETKYAIPDMLPVAERDGEYGVMLIDELPDGNRGVLAALMQLIRERKLGDYKFPENWFIVAAGNRTMDRANVTGNLSSALLSRFIELHVEPDVTEFLEFGQRTGRLNPIIRSYLHFFPQHGHQYPHGMPRNAGQFANWRTWEDAHHIMEWTCDIDVQRVNIVGTIGQTVGVSFNAFRSTIESLPNNIDEVFSDPDNAEVPDKPEHVFALLSLLARKVNPTTFANFIRYAKRFQPEHTENAVFLSTNLNPALKEHDAYIDYKAENNI